MKIIADNTVPFLKGVAEPVADIEYVPAKGFTPQIVKDADCLIVRSIDKCTKELLEGSRVKLITTATIGFDHIDTAFCDEAAITWKNAPGCNARSVGQYVLSSLSTLAEIKKESLKDKTIGIIGVGHVGKEVARLCKAYGMKVLQNDPPREETEGGAEFVSTDVIAKEADIITVHTPLTKTGTHPTHHLINEAFLNKLERKPWFINSARGAIHDTEAILKARKEGKISEFIIDCWENEPAVSNELLKEAAIATPHIAGFSADGKSAATRMCLDNIEEFFNIDFVKKNEICPPAPLNPQIRIHHTDANGEDAVRVALQTSFNPAALTKKLKENPSDFEYLRNNYNNPREYEAYTIVDAKEEEKGLLRSLGFGIQ